MKTFRLPKLRFLYVHGALVPLLLAAIMLLPAGCGTKKKPEKTVKKTTTEMPTGWVEPGTVTLTPLRVKFDLPLRVIAQEKHGQWLANTQNGTFRVAVALFADTTKHNDPRKIVIRRIESLSGETLEPRSLPPEELKRLQAVQGYRSQFVVKESTGEKGVLVASRMYLIQAVRAYDGNVFVISADANEQVFDNAQKMLDDLLQSFEILPRGGNATAEENK